jgi:hypothetical protein
MGSKPNHKYNFQTVFDIDYQTERISVDIENDSFICQNKGASVLQLQFVRMIPFGGFDLFMPS